MKTVEPGKNQQDKNFFLCDDAYKKKKEEAQM